jgi:hypothetical protein
LLAAHHFKWNRTNAVLRYVPEVGPENLLSLSLAENGFRATAYRMVANIPGFSQILRTSGIAISYHMQTNKGSSARYGTPRDSVGDRSYAFGVALTWRKSLATLYLSQGLRPRKAKGSL